MTRPDQISTFDQKRGPVKILLAQKVVMAGPTIPPLTALFGEAVLFLNHCRCAGWSAHLLFAKPRKTVFLTSRPVLSFLNIKKFSTQVLMFFIQNTRIVDKHVLHLEMKNLFLDFN